METEEVPSYKLHLLLELGWLSLLIGKNFLYRCSSQAPRWPLSDLHLLIFTPLVNALPYCTKVGSVWPVAYGRSDGLSSPKSGFKRQQLPFFDALCLFLSLSLCVSLSPGLLTRGSQLPCHEATQAVYRDIHMGKNLGLQTTIRASLEVDPSALFRPQITDCSPANSWIQLLTRPWVKPPNHLAKPCWIPDPQRLWYNSVLL